jgi:phenylalanine-4-hydroxylase
MTVSYRMLISLFSPHLIVIHKCYWFSVEFGLCQEKGVNKAYGAGLLSSFGELEFACDTEHPFAESGLDGPPEFRQWDPEVASKQEFPITTYQPLYFVADSLIDAKQKMRSYCEDLPRPFFALHNKQTDTIELSPVEAGRLLFLADARTTVL